MLGFGPNKIAALLLAFALVPLTSVRTASAAPASVQSWRADHHVHLSSADLCGRLRASDCPDCECIESNHPPAVLASDAIRALDAAGVSRGVVLSSAYLYGMSSLHLSRQEIARNVRLENEFTAAEVRKSPKRLVAFFSVDPLQDSALEEVRYWSDRSEFVGLKLHFKASAVDIRSADHRKRVSGVLAEAAKAHLPFVIHVGGGDFNASDAELFINDVLPNAGDSWVQIAHGGGGLPSVNGNNLSVLRTFGDHIVKDDPRTRRVLFDLSFVPGPSDGPEVARASTRELRRIGIKRFLFGSDFNVQTPAEAITNLKRLDLTAEELQTLSQNCAPWAC